jgi:hypothetical protein
MTRRYVLPNFSGLVTCRPGRAFFPTFAASGRALGVPPHGSTYLMLRCMILIGLLFTTFPRSAHGSPVLLRFDPAHQNVSLGDTVNVDVFLDRLTGDAPAAVGAFDLDVSFNPDILSFDSVTFGSGLGDSLRSSGVSGGTIDIAAVSLLLPSDLHLLQPAEFVLATLSFNAVAKGTSDLAFSQALLFDAFGLSLSAVDGAGSVAVSEPPTSSLVLILAFVGLIRHMTQRGEFRHSRPRA